MSAVPVRPRLSGECRGAKPPRWPVGPFNLATCKPTRRYISDMRRTAWLALLGLGVLAAAGCGLTATRSPSATSPAPTAPSAGGCTIPNSAPYGGAPAALGLNDQGATAPVWSARIGRPQVVEGGRSVGIAYVDNSGTACVVAVDLASGRVAMVDQTPRRPPRTPRGHRRPEHRLGRRREPVRSGPGNVYAAVTGLVAYDPATGSGAMDLQPLRRQPNRSGRARRGRGRRDRGGWVGGRA